MFRNLSIVCVVVIHSLTDQDLMYLQVNEDHNQGVMIKDFWFSYRSTNKLLQVHDLIHTIEGTSLMDMPINKVIEVLERSRGRNTEVTIGFHHIINMNLEINQSSIRQLLPQRYIGRSHEGVCVEKQPFLPVTGNHYHNLLVLGDGTYSKECAKTVSLISAHACPNGTHVIVVSIHQNITKREATEVAQQS